MVSVLSGEPEEETYSLIFSSLKHPVRRKILRILAASPKTFTEILEEIDIESSHLSYHLESLSGLIKKKEGRYALSDFGKAAVTLMAKVEEPEKVGAPAILQAPRRLIAARVLFLSLLVIGGLLVANGILAFPSVSYNETRIQTTIDTDYMVFQPFTVTTFSGYYYQGDGLYGVEIDLVFRDAFSEFPLNVRLSTTTDWNQSWYEWKQQNPPNVPGMRARLSVSLFISGNTFRIISQRTWNHVHPSPGKIIGEFRPASSIVLIKVSSNIDAENVTLAGFRAFQIKWFYFPQPTEDERRTFIVSGIGLIVLSIVFMLVIRSPHLKREPNINKPNAYCLMP